MTPSSCPWRTRALGSSPAGSPASGRCTSSAGPGSRWPTRTSSPGCATRTWRTTRMEPRPLQSRMGESAPGQGQGFWPNIHPQLPVVIWQHQQQHSALLQRLLQLDSTPFDPEEPPSSASLLPASPAGAGADPDRRGTGGGPLARCFQRHLLRAGLPVAGPRSLPRDLHLLRRQGSPGLPVLLPALLREVSRRRDPASAPRGPSVCGFLASLEGHSRSPRPASVPSSQGKAPSGPSSPLVVWGVCSGSLGHVGLGPLPDPGKVAPPLSVP